MCHRPHTCSGAAATAAAAAAAAAMYCVVTTGAIPGSCIESCSGLHAVDWGLTDKAGMLLYVNLFTEHLVYRW